MVQVVEMIHEVEPVFNTLTEEELSKLSHKNQIALAIFCLKQRSNHESLDDFPPEVKEYLTLAERWLAGESVSKEELEAAVETIWKIQYKHQTLGEVAHKTYEHHHYYSTTSNDGRVFIPSAFKEISATRAADSWDEYLLAGFNRVTLGLCSSILDAILDTILNPVNSRNTIVNLTEATYTSNPFCVPEDIINEQRQYYNNLLRSQTMEEIQAQYQQLCTILGDLEVKLQGLKNQRKAIFQKMEELDKAMAEQIQAQQQDNQ